MTKETLLEVISELIGYTEPCGNCDIDMVRYFNQEKIIELVTNGIDDLIHNVTYRDMAEYSMARIGSRTYETLEKLYNIIGNNI